MVSSSRTARRVAMVSALGAFTIAFGACTTETTSAQEPSWHAPFNQATAAGRAWPSSPGISYPRGGYGGGTQGTQIWRRNQQTVRLYNSLPPYPSRRTYATPTPRRVTVVARPTRSWSSSSGRPFRGLFARRWR